MTTLTTELPYYPVGNPAIAESTATDRDIPEIALRFGQQYRSGQSAILTPTDCPDFKTSTFGEVTFRRVDPLREPLIVADQRLQKKLEVLCDTLRAKY